MSHLWTEIAGRAGTPLDSLQLAALHRYLDLLLEWNKRLNLTRITERPQAELLHVADALTLLPHLPPRGELIDVGTGGGLPGVPLAIARPGLRATLLDATRKKLDAIDSILSALRLDNVVTLHARAESVRDRFDVVVARAVASVGQMVLWVDRMCGPRTRVLLPKGPRAPRELQQASDAGLLRGWSACVHPVNVDGLDGHVIVELRRS